MIKETIEYGVKSSKSIPGYDIKYVKQFMGADGNMKPFTVVVTEIEENLGLGVITARPGLPT